MSVSSPRGMREAYSNGPTIDHSGGNITGDMRETRHIEYGKIPLKTLRRHLEKDGSMDFGVAEPTHLLECIA